MVDHVSAVLACFDLAITSGNAAAQHVLTMRSNKGTLAELSRHFGDLRGALSSMRADPKLHTPVWRDILESVKAYFERAGEAFAKMSRARRALAPRQVAGTLNGLVRDLLHVESLLLGLDGFDNVDRLVTDLGVVSRDNEAALVGIDEELNRVPYTLQLVLSDIDIRFGRQDGRQCGLLDRLGKLDRVAELLLGKLDTQAAFDVRLGDLLEALEAVSVLQPTTGTPLARTAAANPNDYPGGAAVSYTGGHNEPNDDATVLDYDDMNVRFAQVNSNLDRLLTAVQKGRAPAGEKSEIAQLIRYLFEPWRIDPAMVSYSLDKEIGTG
jgi:hypothetical protein